MRPLRISAPVAAALLIGCAAEVPPSPPSKPIVDGQVHTVSRSDINAVVALANAMLFATPPLLLLPQAIEILHLSTDAEFIHLNSARVAFQPRAPPLS